MNVLTATPRLYKNLHFKNLLGACKFVGFSTGICFVEKFRFLYAGFSVVKLGTYLDILRRELYSVLIMIALGLRLNFMHNILCYSSGHLLN